MSNKKNTVKETLGGKPSIKKFVDGKLAQFDASDRTMRALYGLMFSESQNVMGESTDGYRIRSVTYGESRANVEKRAAQLCGLLHGVDKNAIVGLYLDNSMDWIEYFWAILKAGYRPLLMNMRLSDEVLDRVVKEYDVAAVISESKTFVTRNLRLADIKDADDSAQPAADVFANEIFLMSSNTSDHLKICGYTGEQFYNQIHDSAGIVKHNKACKKHYDGRLKLLTILPFYHIFGLVAVYIWFCFFSRTLVFLRDLDPKTVINTIRKHKVTHIFAVPVFWEKVYRSAMAAIKERGEKTYKKFCTGLKLSQKLSSVPWLGKFFAKKAFREVRDNMFGESAAFMINGGGYISEDIMRFVNGIGYYLVNGYGMTELGITSVELSEKQKVRNLCSVGKPFGSVEYDIRGGELYVRGRSIAHSIYADGVQRTVDPDEWFNTHDLFELKNGRYYICGRKDDLIICADGENVNPNLTEPQLAVDGANRLCLVPSPKNAGKMTLLAEVRRGAEREEWARVKAELAQKVSELHLDGAVDGIALTVTPLMDADDFKIVRKKVAARFAAGEYRTVDPESKADYDEADAELVGRVRAIFARALNKQPEDIGVDSHFFFELGGTSIDYFAMVSDAQAQFGIPFPAEAGSGVSTVQDMVKYIKKRLD